MQIYMQIIELLYFVSEMENIFRISVELVKSTSVL